MEQSCKSGSGLKLKKISGLIRAWNVLFVVVAQKYNQTNFAKLLNFSDLTFGLFRIWFELQNSFRAGFGPELIGPFTTLLWRCMSQSLNKIVTSLKVEKV